MKLDRNINPDGRGKYALINLRKISDEEFSEILEARRDKGFFGLHSDSLSIGDEKDGQFFVIKYKDRFAEPALRAYADACRAHASQLQAEAKDGTQLQDAIELLEFAAEMDLEADTAKAIPFRAIPT